MAPANEVAQRNCASLTPSNQSALSARQKNSGRVIHQWKCGSLATFALLAMLATSVWRPRPLLIWNASPSSRVGLYRVRRSILVKTGAMVLAWAPQLPRRLAAERHYLPYSVPLVKEVAAAAGDRVCAREEDIFVNGHRAAVRLRRDSAGRPLPWWQGCRTLRSGETLLLSANVARAFDGRYFGITERTDIIGEAVLLWAR